MWKNSTDLTEPNPNPNIKLTVQINLQNCQKTQKCPQCSNALYSNLSGTQLSVEVHPDDISRCLRLQQQKNMAECLGKTCQLTETFWKTSWMDRKVLEDILKNKGHFLNNQKDILNGQSRLAIQDCYLSVADNVRQCLTDRHMKIRLNKIKIDKICQKFNTSVIVRRFWKGL